jgi:hypothetical protein
VRVGNHRRYLKQIALFLVQSELGKTKSDRRMAGSVGPTHLKVITTVEKIKCRQQHLAHLKHNVSCKRIGWGCEELKKN